MQGGLIRIVLFSSSLLLVSARNATISTFLSELQNRKTGEEHVGWRPSVLPPTSFLASSSVEAVNPEGEMYLVHASKEPALAKWFGTISTSAKGIRGGSSACAGTKDKMLLPMISTSILTADTAEWWSPFGPGVKFLLDPDLCTHYVGAPDMDALFSGNNCNGRYAPAEKRRAAFLGDLLRRRREETEDGGKNMMEGVYLLKKNSDLDLGR